MAKYFSKIFIRDQYAQKMTPVVRNDDGLLHNNHSVDDHIMPLKGCLLRLT